MNNKKDVTDNQISQDTKDTPKLDINKLNNCKCDCGDCEKNEEDGQAYTLPDDKNFPVIN